MSEEPVREADRRKLNVVEGLILAGLIGMGAMLFSMRESVIRLEASGEANAKILIGLQSQLADIPQINQRLSRAEVRIESAQAELQELRQTRHLK